MLKDLKNEYMNILRRAFFFWANKMTFRVDAHVYMCLCLVIACASFVYNTLSYTYKPSHTHTAKGISHILNLLRLHFAKSNKPRSSVSHRIASRSFGILCVRAACVNLVVGAPQFFFCGCC